MEIDVSVVVPFYNAGKYIEECVKALLAQNYPSTRYEIIMVDNNSTDGSAEIVRKYPRIKLLSEPKQGSYAARNRGVAASKGTVIAFTDADCVPSPDWLQKILSSLRSPEIGVVQGSRLFAIESPILSMLAAYDHERTDYILSKKSGGIYYGYTNNMAVRRDLFYRYGPFPEIMRGADSIFVHRITEGHSHNVVRYEPDARIRHLEITSLWSYLRKRFIYGRSFRQNYTDDKRSDRNILTPIENSAIIKMVIQRNGYSLLQTLCLIILIRMGKFCYKFGSLSARYSLKLWLNDGT